MTSGRATIEAWVTDTCGSTVVSTTRLVGGMSSLVRRHDLADGRRAVSRQNGPTALLHRDLHPLNLLWSDDESVAVVDWVNACVGHPHAELGHLRWNLAVLVDIDAADELLAHYLAITGDDAYDPYWDLAPLMSHVDWPFEVDAWQSVGRTDLDRATVLRRSEAFTRHVVEH